MSGRPPIVLLCAAILAQLTLALGFAAGAVGGEPPESANPINDQGASYHYRSNITSVTPRVSGLSIQVLEFADRLLLRNHTGRTVTIYGYSGEPYARVLANGSAEQNSRSPATYLNTSFYGDVTVPPSASTTAPPHWVLVDRTGQFEWHDHRIHYNSPAVPFQVRDRSKRTLVFDWSVPIAVASQRGAIAGQLFWVPQSATAPVGAYVLGGAIIAAGLLLTLIVRRRRARPGRRSPEQGGGSGPGPTDVGSREAW